MALLDNLPVAVIDAAPFLNMPSSARLLFYDLCAHAEDDGFVASPDKISSVTDRDMELLASEGYIIPFGSGVYINTDWTNVH